MEAAAGTRSHRRLEFLDASRGLAALAVILYHTLSGQNAFFAHWMKGVENLGTFGVTVFFLVSGFIIPISLERKTLPAFWKARCFRLLPAYWAAALATWVLGAFGVVSINEEFFHLHARWVFVNAFMLVALISGPVLLGVAWTLSIELVFYVLCSGLKAMDLLSKRLVVAWGAVGAELAVVVAAQIHLLPRQHIKVGWIGLLVMASVGGVFFEVAEQRLSHRVLWPLVAAATAVTSFCNYLEFCWFPPSTQYEIQPKAALVAWVLGIAFFVIMFLLRQFHFAKPLLWLGRISYSSYLLHNLVFAVVFRRLLSLGLAAAECVSLAVILLLADLVYRFVEVPGNRLGHQR